MHIHWSSLQYASFCKYTPDWTMTFCCCLNTDLVRSYLVMYMILGIALIMLSRRYFWRVFLACSSFRIRWNVVELVRIVSVLQVRDSCSIIQCYTLDFQFSYYWSIKCDCKWSFLMFLWLAPSWHVTYNAICGLQIIVLCLYIRLHG